VNDERWAAVAELGTMRALRFAGWMHRTFGRRFCTPLVWPFVVYYWARSADARRASRRYLERMYASPEGREALGRAPGPLLELRHLHAFAESLYDRLLVWSGSLEDMVVEHDGSERIFELAREGRGALLLGAHLGSIDMLWFLSRKYDLTVNVVLFYQNAERVNAFFESLAPDARIRAIDIDPGSVRAAFEIRSCIERGEFVVILADRTAPGKGGRTADTTFLGAPARFPLAPFLLAGVLDCAAELALCVRTDPGRYVTVMRPIAPAQRVPRAERDKRAVEALERYVSGLETWCRRHPLQWFNFYDFWGA
jgi:predicted LPLAT superfamily acyltransferase